MKNLSIIFCIMIHTLFALSNQAFSQSLEDTVLAEAIKKIQTDASNVDLSGFNINQPDFNWLANRIKEQRKRALDSLVSSGHSSIIGERSRDIIGNRQITPFAGYQGSKIQNIHNGDHIIAACRHGIIASKLQIINGNSVYIRVCAGERIEEKYSNIGAVPLAQFNQLLLTDRKNKGISNQVVFTTSIQDPSQFSGGCSTAEGLEKLYRSSTLSAARPLTSRSSPQQPQLRAIDIQAQKNWLNVLFLKCVDPKQMSYSPTQIQILPLTEEFKKLAKQKAYDGIKFFESGIESNKSNTSSGCSNSLFSDTPCTGQMRRAN